MACLIDGEFKLTNNGRTNIYKPYNLYEAGVEQRDGLHIELSDSFHILVQNTSKNLNLRVIIFDSSGAPVYEDVVSQYGVINVEN